MILVMIYDFNFSWAAKICANLKNNKFSAFYLLILCSFPAYAQEWTLKKNEEGIKVYTRLPEGSKLEEVRATVRVKTSLSAFTALLKDVPGYTDWAYNCVESKMVLAICDTAQCYYSHTSLPWPASDRDLIFRSSLKQDEETKIIRTNSVCVPDMLDENEGIVRIREGITAWTLTPVAGGFVDVNYYVNINPGGSVPAWLVNSTIDMGPFNALQKVRELLEGGKYKNATFWFIKELGE
jgi:hypothetical protein